MKPELIRISKFLSLVLRHKPEQIGLELDESGWVSVEILLKACRQHGVDVTITQLKDVVAQNDKKRFSFSSDGTLIRASQGHSVEVELGYDAQVPPDILYHGTAVQFVESIRAKGLQKRQRHAVHLSTSKETAAAVGTRHGKLVIFVVKSGQMHQEGYKFFLSDNGVWLTDHVPPKYLLFAESD